MLKLSPIFKGTLALCIAPFLLEAASFQLELDDARIPPRIREQLDAAKAQEIFIKGLAAEYPGWIIPADAHEAPTLGREPLVEELPQNACYIRLYDLPSAQAKLLEKKDVDALIIDARYVISTAESEPFPDEFLAARSEKAALLIINSKTAGPWEAAIAEQERAGKLVTIGNPTAGQPGIYEPFSLAPQFKILKREFVPEGGNSILHTGISPKVSVHTTPEEEFQAYHLVEKGAAVETVINADNLSKPRSKDDVYSEKTPQETSEQIVDAALQRAMELIVALQILGKLPS